MCTCFKFNVHFSGITEQWLIYNTLSYDYEIVIETVDSRIEDSVNCEFDKVKLYEGNFNNTLVVPI